MSEITDIELLELAAKAAGIAPGINGYMEPCFFDGRNEWNPLADDGDALRLAVRLQMSLSLGPCRIQACTITGALRGAFFQEDTISQDDGVATRRAIVIAAAEIGKSK